MIGQTEKYASLRLPDPREISFLLGAFSFRGSMQQGVSVHKSSHTNEITPQLLEFIRRRKQNCRAGGNDRGKSSVIS